VSGEKPNRAPIQWFPGHMTRTLRRAKEKLPQVDAVVQLLDARMPHASLNPELQALSGGKPRLYVMNKADLADEAVTARWLRFFTGEEMGCVAINSKAKGSSAKARQAVEGALGALFAKRERKGMQGAKTRLMVTGIPNVGKSTFINNWAGGARAKAADRPGVTRGEQWISAGAYELMDMPGVLWKRFDDAHTAVNLALIGSIPDKLLDTEEIAAGLLAQLGERYAKELNARFKLTEDDLAGEGWQILEAVGRRRGMLMGGGEVDTHRAAIVVLDEFRGGKLGRVSLETPEEMADGKTTE